MDESGKTIKVYFDDISSRDRARAESGKTGSKSSKKKEQPSYRSNPANRKKFLRDNPNMTDKDFDKLFKAKGGSVDELGKMLNRNDGGMAMKTRVF